MKAVIKSYNGRINWEIVDIDLTEKEYQEALKWKERLDKMVYQSIVKFGELKKLNKKHRSLQKKKDMAKIK